MADKPEETQPSSGFVANMADRWGNYVLGQPNYNFVPTKGPDNTLSFVQRPQPNTSPSAPANPFATATPPNSGGKANAAFYKNLSDTVNAQWAVAQNIANQPRYDAINKPVIDTVQKMNGGEFSRLLDNISGGNSNIYRGLAAGKLTPDMPGTFTVERDGRDITLPQFSPQTGAAPNATTVPASRENLIRYRMQPDGYGNFYQVPSKVAYDTNAANLRMMLSEKENNESYQGKYSFPTLTIKDPAKGIDLEANANGARKGPRSLSQAEREAAVGDNPMGRGGKTFMDGPAYGQGYRRETFDQMNARMAPVYDYKKTDPQKTNLQVPGQLRTPGAPFGFVENPYRMPALPKLFATDTVSAQASPEITSGTTTAGKVSKEQLTPRDLFPDKAPGEALTKYLQKVGMGQPEPVRVTDAATNQSKYYLTDTKPDPLPSTPQESQAYQLKTIRNFTDQVVRGMQDGSVPVSLETQKKLAETIKLGNDLERAITAPKAKPTPYSLDQRGADSYAAQQQEIVTQFNRAIAAEPDPKKKAVYAKRKAELLRGIDETFFKKTYAPYDPVRGMTKDESAVETFEKMTD